MEKASLVFIPLPVMSHLAPALMMAELLARRDARLSITVLIISIPIETNISSYISNQPHPRINFVHLKQDKELDKSVDPKWHFVGNHKLAARNAVSEMMKLGRIAGLVVDLICMPMIDVAKELNIPSYAFLPSGAASLGLMLDLQSLCDGSNEGLAEYVDLDAAVSISTYVNPVPARLWPDDLYEGDCGLLHLVRKLREVDGIIVNTFSELEPYATASIFADVKIPKVYTVGPIVRDEKVESSHKLGETLRGWLDVQPDSSVAYICFGTMGAFAAEQVEQIAAALEQSGVRFLWSLKKPFSGEGVLFPGDYEDPGEVLPEGFLERTARVGKVISWAPQMAVLSHPAVGGFVSHCGWNSILESVWCGVPMATFPLQADQQINAFELVKDIGIAVEIKMDYKISMGVIVSEGIIAEAIQQLMDPKNEIRVRVGELKEKSRRTLMEGGSSYNLLGLLIDKFMNI